MSAPLPSALRARFQQFIEEGLSGRAAALRLRLSPATGARWARHVKTRGHAAPAPQGRPRDTGKLAPHRAFFEELQRPAFNLIHHLSPMAREREAWQGIGDAGLRSGALVRQDPDITLFELRDALADAEGVQVHHSSIADLLSRLGFTYKKSRWSPPNATVLK